MWINVGKNAVGADVFHLHGDGFTISYTPAAPESFDLSRTVRETALIVNSAKRKYFILNGDWRAEYEHLAPKGLDACMEFYLANEAEFGSRWSSSES